jgi:hypothetical protein
MKKKTLLTYVHPLTGTTSVEVEVTGLPVYIQVVDHHGARVSAEMVPLGANTVQLGPGGRHGTGVKVRAVNEDPSTVRRTMSMIMPGASFSQVSSASTGTTIQCAGTTSMGVDREPGVRLTVPAGSYLDMKDHGPVTVDYGGQVMTLGDAAGQGLLDVN